MWNCPIRIVNNVIYIARPFRFCSHASGPDINIIRAWSWIENAEYRGQKEFNKKKVNVWAYNVSLNFSLAYRAIMHIILILYMQDTQNNVYNEIGVSAKNVDRPVFVFEESSESFEVTVFQTFRSSVASPANLIFLRFTVLRNKFHWLHNNNYANRRVVHSGFVLIHQVHERRKLCYCYRQIKTMNRQNDTIMWCQWI